MSMRRHRVQGAPEKVWAVVQVEEDGTYSNYRLYSKLSAARGVCTRENRHLSSQSELWQNKVKRRYAIVETTTVEWEEVE